MNILVGMSGGVDSSVAALLLKKAGHNVIGATMSIWRGERKDVQACSHGACYGPDETEDIESAQKICKQLGIEYQVFDCINQYEQIVLENFKKEYLAGRTPNPCIWCNALIKFDLLPALAKANGIEFDKFATGHYARVCFNNNRYFLKTGKDYRKDQSYFLYRLKQEQLENVCFPLGDYTKEDIRKIASDYGLDVAEKPDSQDFYAGEYNELLGVLPKKGNIVNINGEILGEHEGIWNYTIGQRKGLGVSASEPLYVLELRKETNEVVVGFKDKTMSNRLTAGNMNWIAFEKPPVKINCKAKIRSSQLPTDVEVISFEDGNIEVTFENMQKSIAPGQSIVLYDGDNLLGGGIIL